MTFHLFDGAPADRHRQPAPQRAFDLTVALPLLVLALPVIALAAVAVRATSRGTAFYSQVRLGRNGRPFRILKLRTMVHDCEAASGIRWAQERDPRVTPLGEVLRKLHLDELPQLWNVIRGEMSVVGPRPERPEIVAELEHAFPAYRERLAVNPGITGLAQIQLPADRDVNGVRDKHTIDLIYIQRRTVWLDARILVATALYLLGLPREAVRRMTFLPAASPPSAPVPQALSAAVVEG